MRSVRDNRYYPVIPATQMQANSPFQKACIDMNWDNQCGANEALVQLPLTVTHVLDEVILHRLPRRTAVRLQKADRQRHHEACVQPVPKGLDLLPDGHAIEIAKP